MAERSKTKKYSKTGAATLEFDDFELQSTMQSFLSEDEKESGKGVWNFSTIAGMVMLFTGVTFLLQWIGLPLGGFLTDFSTGLMPAMPLIGGLLVTFIGFGYFVGDRRKEKKRKREERKKRRKNFSTSKSMDDVHGAETKSSFNSGLRNDLDSDFNSSSSSAGFEDYGMSGYGYRHQKKLMKSRSDKKWAGVCGGLAKYFGISSTVVRFIFVAAFFMGYGASLLIYLGLSLAMPKEPVELMDDFDF